MVAEFIGVQYETKRARLIYNPTSGQEIMKKNVAEVLDILEGAGFETSAQTTPDENSAKNGATRAAKAGFDLVIAAGGDGTINEVVSGIAPRSKCATNGSDSNRQRMTLRVLWRFQRESLFGSNQSHCQNKPSADGRWSYL